MTYDAFDMADFKKRCNALMARLDRSAHTISRRLFKSPQALPDLLEEKRSPRYDTLIEARTNLEAWEAELNQEANNANAS